MTEKMVLDDGRIGIIGVGNMGEAILWSLFCKGIKSKNVLISEKEEQRRDFLKRKYPMFCERAMFSNQIFFDNKKLVKDADIIILAVKPHQLEEVLKEIAPAVTKDKFLVSIAAGVKLRQIEAWLQIGKYGDYEKVFRVMPNMFMQVGEGMIEICRNAPFGEHHSKEDLDIVKQIFSAGGKVMIVDEKDIDAFSSLAGSSPAYMALIARAFINAGIEQGIDAETSKQVVAQLFEGIAAMLKAGENLRDIEEMVCSPGGSTIQGLGVLEKSGLVGIIMEVIKVARYGAAGLGQKE